MSVHIKSTPAVPNQVLVLTVAMSTTVLLLVNELLAEQYLQMGLYRNATSLVRTRFWDNLLWTLLPLELCWMYARQLSRVLHSRWGALTGSGIILGIQIAALAFLHQKVVNAFYEHITPMAAAAHGIDQSRFSEVRSLLSVMLGPSLSSIAGLSGSLRISPEVFAASLAIVAIISFAALLQLAIVVRRTLGLALAQPPPLRPKRSQIVALGIVVGAIVFGQAVLVAHSVAPYTAPNILVISIDTLRADHANLLGQSGRISMPNLNRMTEGSTVFTRAYSQSSWTLPSHASMLTGLQPIEHGCNAVEGIRLAPGLLTVPELLRENGYRTFLASTVAFLTSAYGMEQGFDRTYFGLDHSEKVIEQTISFIRANADSEPIFAFVHLFDPHDPYRTANALSLPWIAPNDLTETSDGDIGALLMRGVELAPDSVTTLALQRLYDAEIWQTDMYIERLLNSLMQSNLTRAISIIITSDHGEAFGEYGNYTHGQSLEPSMLHVPLMILAPNAFPAGTVTIPVEANRQVAAAVVKIAGIPAPSDWPSAITGNSEGSTRFVFAETMLHGNRRIAVIDEREHIEFAVQGANLVPHQRYNVLKPGTTLSIENFRELDDYRLAAESYLHLPSIHRDTSNPVLLAPSEREILKSLRYLK